MNKISAFLILILTATSVISCEKYSSDDEVSVKQYIRLLKSGNYDARELPDFTYEQIPQLLKYRNSKKVIKDFPRNPISSYAGYDCTLGIYVLWTIESIRSVAIESEFLINKFPSSNPILGYRNSDFTDWVDDDTSQNTAADAYYNWYFDNENKSFDEYKDIDPLEDTDYIWR